MFAQLEQETLTFVDWKSMHGITEFHGLGPLLYSHLKPLNDSIPIEEMRILRGLYLRHRTSNEILSRSLCEIIKALQDQGISALVLKGAALCHMVYPQIALRPMRDLDILVRQKDAIQAQSVLIALGYGVNSGIESSHPKDHHHLPHVNRIVDGLSVSVEIHHDLFVPTQYCRSVRFEEIIDEAFAFPIGNNTVYTLGQEDMLWHIYRHAIGPHLLATPLRLVSIADLVSLVERYIDQIDWDHLKNRYPQLFNALPMLHWVTPWSERVLAKLDLDPLVPPDFVWRDYQGWPRVKMRTGELRTFMRDTFSPSEWWVRFCYGIRGKWAWIWYHYIRHPIHVMDGMTHQMKTGLKNRISSLRQSYIPG